MELSTSAIDNSFDVSPHPHSAGSGKEPEALSGALALGASPTSGTIASNRSSRAHNRTTTDAWSDEGAATAPRTVSRRRLDTSMPR